MTIDETAACARALDKFYTTDATARMCIGAVWRECRLSADDLFVEPSAGAGAFCRHLPAERLIALDIAPDAPGIAEADFLSFTAPRHDGRIIVLGNPPFGRSGRLAKRFIQHATHFADVIAFILPASFAKSSMQRRIDPHFHLCRQIDLPEEPFLIEGAVHRVNCVFQIWERRDDKRVDQRQADVHPDFEFVADLKDADVIIRRTGSRAGVLLPFPGRDAVENVEGLKGYSRSSNYFIRAVGCGAGDLRERLEQLPLATAAARAVQPSLARTEIVSLYSQRATVTQDQAAPLVPELGEKPRLARNATCGTIPYVVGISHSSETQARPLGRPWHTRSTEAKKWTSGKLSRPSQDDLGSSIGEASVDPTMDAPAICGVAVACPSRRHDRPHGAIPPDRSPASPRSQTCRRQLIRDWFAHNIYLEQKRGPPHGPLRRIAKRGTSALSVGENEWLGGHVGDKVPWRACPRCGSRSSGAKAWKGMK